MNERLRLQEGQRRLLYIVMSGGKGCRYVISRFGDAWVSGLNAKKPFYEKRTETE